MPLWPGTLVCVAVGTIDAAGRVIQMELAGAAGPERTTERQTRPEGVPALDPLDTDSWRQAVGGACSCCFSPGPGALSRGAVRRFVHWQSVVPGDPSLGLALRSASDVLIGLWPMPGGADSGRILWVQVARDDSQTFAATDETVLRAVFPILARLAARSLGSSPLEASRILTHREQVVLDLLTRGRTVRQIAEELGRSPHTISDHIKSLHRKLGASSRGELIARALRGGTPRVNEPAGTRA